MKPTCPICGGEILLEHILNLSHVYKIDKDKFIREDNNDLINSGGWVRLICENDREHQLEPTPTSDIPYNDFIEWKDAITDKFYDSCDKKNIEGELIHGMFARYSV
jgi:hypothetical protein